MVGDQYAPNGIVYSLAHEPTQFIRSDKDQEMATSLDPGPQDVIGQLTSAWNAAAAFAQLFTEDATLVTP